MKITKILTRLVYGGVISFILASCTFPLSTSPQPVITATFRPLPTNTEQPTATYTPTPTTPPTETTTPVPTNTVIPTKTTPQPVPATVSAEILNVREGPGTVFKIIFKLNEGDEVTVISQAPGGEWVKLKANDAKEGWAALSYLSLPADSNDIALQTIDFTYVIHGRVVDQEGKPVNAINISIHQGTGVNERRTDANTNVDGEFYAFLPREERARWQVEVVGIGCTSNIVDAECKYTGRFEPAVVTIELPQVIELVNFTYIKP